MNNASRSIAQLVAKIKALPKEQYDYLEVKQLAEILARHRAKMRMAIVEYRVLHASIGAQSDAIEKMYMGYEAMFLRDYLRDAWRLYRLVSNDFHMAYTVYMKMALNTPVLPAGFTYNFVESDTGLPQSSRNAA